MAYEFLLLSVSTREASGFSEQPLSVCLAKLVSTTANDITVATTAALKTIHTFFIGFSSLARFLSLKQLRDIAIKFMQKSFLKASDIYIFFIFIESVSRTQELLNHELGLGRNALLRIKNFE